MVAAPVAPVKQGKKKMSAKEEAAFKEAQAAAAAASASVVPTIQVRASGWCFGVCGDGGKDTWARPTVRCVLGLAGVVDGWSGSWWVEGCFSSFYPSPVMPMTCPTLLHGCQVKEISGRNINTLHRSVSVGSDQPLFVSSGPLLAVAFKRSLTG